MLTITQTFHVSSKDSLFDLLSEHQSSTRGTVIEYFITANFGDYFDAKIIFSSPEGMWAFVYEWALK